MWNIIIYSRENSQGNDDSKRCSKVVWVERVCVSGYLDCYDGEAINATRV